uniref:Uncharacterized protein n=1 Tax=Parascaris equorum TaxID=6256 RepID=A0A914R622_PAREQ
MRFAHKHLEDQKKSALEHPNLRYRHQAYKMLQNLHGNK